MNIHAFIDRLKKTVESTEQKLASIRTGRANPDLLSRIMVDCYGSQVPIQQLASISAQDGNMLLLNVFDRGSLESVAKAIQRSDLGLTPQTDGNVIRLRLPELTEQRRLELVKVVKQQGEEGKVAIRNIRRDAIDGIKKDEELSDDEKKREQNGIQKKVDEYSLEIDKLCDEKEKEILQI